MRLDFAAKQAALVVGALEHRGKLIDQESIAGAVGNFEAVLKLQKVAGY
jgi:hypothetical protein